MLKLLKPFKSISLLVFCCLSVYASAQTITFDRVYTTTGTSSVWDNESSWSCSNCGTGSKIPPATYTLPINVIINHSIGSGTSYTYGGNYFQLDLNYPLDLVNLNFSSSMTGNVVINGPALLKVDELNVATNKTTTVNAPLELKSKSLTVIPKVNTIVNFNNSVVFHGGTCKLNIGTYTSQVYGTITFNGTFTNTEAYWNNTVSNCKFLYFNGVTNIKNLEILEGSSVFMNNTSTITNLIFTGTVSPNLTLITGKTHTVESIIKNSSYVITVTNNGILKYKNLQNIEHNRVCPCILTGCLTRTATEFICDKGATISSVNYVQIENGSISESVFELGTVATAFWILNDDNLQVEDLEYKLYNYNHVDVSDQAKFYKVANNGKYMLDVASLTSFSAGMSYIPLYTLELKDRSGITTKYRFLKK